MGKNKLGRFNENKTFALLYQPEFEEIFRKEYYLKGHWNELAFKREAPICLELGCGKGEYTLALARKYPEQNFIGVDIKGARLWRGVKTATEESMTNAAFLRTRIEFIESLFSAGEVSEIWITFPDPQIGRDRKRLTNHIFLERYRTFLKPNATIHLKTDSLFLHEFTRDLVNQAGYPLIQACTDVYGTGLDQEVDILSVHTFYEEQYLAKGIPITYLAFKLP